MTQKITAIFGIAVLAAILLGGLTFSQSAFAGQGGGPGQQKVTLCHVDEDGEKRTITVGAPAVPAHLAHGDTLGPCVEEPEPFTCDECNFIISDEIDSCADDVDCLISAWKNYADCSLTCEGTSDGDPQECANQSAEALGECMETAIDEDDLSLCTNLWKDVLNECVFGPGG